MAESYFRLMLLRLNSCCKLHESAAMLRPNTSVERTGQKRPTALLGSTAYQPMFPHILITAATPALLGSLLLLNIAAAPRTLLLQQAIVGIAAVVAVLLSARYFKPSSALNKTPWLLLGMAAVVCAPILSGRSSAASRKAA